jgi:YD repeat-containing protein
MRDATGTVNLVTELTYDARGRVETLTDEGATTRRFAYDGFGRLSEVKNHANEPVEAYAYHYSRTSGNNWTFNPAQPNRVETTTYLAHVPSAESVTTREWLDGLGRPIQTHVQDSVSRYAVTATEYDGMGREQRNWNPYFRTGTSFDGSFAASAAAHYNAYPNLSSTTPYREVEYTPDGRSRVKRETAPCTASAGPAATEYAQGGGPEVDGGVAVSPGGYESARNAGSGSLPKFRIAFRLDRRRPSMSGVEQFPRRIQITFGGAPYRKLNWWKSESSETIVNFTSAESRPAFVRVQPRRPMPPGCPRAPGRGNPRGFRLPSSPKPGTRGCHTP